MSWSNPKEERYAKNTAMDELYWSWVISPFFDYTKKFETMDVLLCNELKKLRKGDFDYLYDEENSERLNLLFLLMRRTISV